MRTACRSYAFYLALYASFIRKNIAFKNSFRRRSRGRSGIVLPAFVLVTVGVVTDRLENNTRHLIPHASTFHFKSDSTSLFLYSLSVDCRFENNHGRYKSLVSSAYDDVSVRRADYEVLQGSRIFPGAWYR